MKLMKVKVNKTKNRIPTDISDEMIVMKLTKVKVSKTKNRIPTDISDETDESEGK